MRILIAEDDFVSRHVLLRFLQDVGLCDVAAHGEEALSAFTTALDSGSPYSLVCLDIMMPAYSGREILAKIRAEEARRGIGGLDATKVIMTSALNDKNNILGSFRDGCEAYLVKPVDRAQLMRELEKLGLGGRESRPTA